MGFWNPLTWFNNKNNSDESSDINDSYFNGDDDYPNNNNQTLSDIVRGIAHAAGAANEIQDRQFIQQINHYFHKEEDGTLVPKVARARIDDNTYIEVPLISMIDPSTLGLEEMEVRMGVRLSRSEVKEHVHDANKDVKVSRCSFNVALTSAKPGDRQDVIDVTMKFKKVEPTEGSSRFIEEMNGVIQPNKYNDKPKRPNNLTNIFHTKNCDESELDDENETSTDGIIIIDDDIDNSSSSSSSTDHFD